MATGDQVTRSATATPRVRRGFSREQLVALAEKMPVVDVAGFRSDVAGFRSDVDEKTPVTGVAKLRATLDAALRRRHRRG